MAIKNLAEMGFGTDDTDIADKVCKRLGVPRYDGNNFHEVYHVAVLGARFRNHERMESLRAAARARTEAQIEAEIEAYTREAAQRDAMAR